MISEDLTTPEHELHAPARPALYDLWLMPIRKPLAQASATAEKPIGEMTVPDLMAWVYVLGYGGISGYIAGRLIGNLLVVALGGPRRR
jgi:hypothetical protein